MRVAGRLLASQRLTILQDYNFSRRSVRTGHDGIDGGSLVFQSQQMRPGFGSFEVLCGRSPPPARIEKSLFRFLGKNIVGNLIFLESSFVADPPTPVPQVKFAGGAVADRARMIFLTQRLNYRWQVQRRINLAQQLLNHLFALCISALSEMAEA